MPHLNVFLMLVLLRILFCSKYLAKTAFVHLHHSTTNSFYTNQTTYDSTHATKSNKTECGIHCQQCYSARYH